MEGGAKEILLLVFGDELDVSPRCGERHLLPLWGSPTPGDRVCVSCGVISATAKIDAA